MPQSKPRVVSETPPVDEISELRTAEVRVIDVGVDVESVGGRRGADAQAEVINVESEVVAVPVVFIAYALQ